MVSQRMQSFIFPSIQVLYLLIKARTGKKKKRTVLPPNSEEPKPGGTQYLLVPSQISQVKMTSILHMCEGNKKSTLRVDYGSWLPEVNHVWLPPLTRRPAYDSTTTRS